MRVDTVPSGRPGSAGTPTSGSPGRVGGSATTSTPPQEGTRMSEQAAPASPIEPWLREILRCPACRSELLDVDR